MKPRLSNYEITRLLSLAATWSPVADRTPEDEQVEIARVFQKEDAGGKLRRGTVIPAPTGNSKTAEVVTTASETLAVRLAAKLNREYGLHVKPFRRSIIVLPEETGITATVFDRALREIQN